MSKIAIISAAFVVIAAQGLIFVPSTYATKSDKVTICHATNSQKNPYVKITVNSSSIEEQNHVTPNGHGTHEGGVWSKGTAAHSWGDIIPAFESPEGTKCAGMNWNDAGQAIYNKGCSMVAATDTTAPGNGTTTPADDTKESTKDADATETETAESADLGQGSATPANDSATAAAELPHTGPVASAALMGSALSGATYLATRKLQKK